MNAKRPLFAVNDGSDAAPRIDIQQSWWGMNKLGEDGREWSLERKFEKIAEAGFTGILGALPEAQHAETWHRLLEQYGLSFGTHAFPAKREDLPPVLKAAKQFGALYVNSQVMDGFVIGEAAVELLSGLLAEAAEEQLPYFIETHRARVTQDLHRTVDYVRALPDLRLTIDLSHYVVAGEMTGRSDKAEPLFDVLLERTSSLHARVSNGEQVQVDIGPDGEHPMVPHFMRWWEKGMRSWLRQAGPGDILPFVVELGPPLYSITSGHDADAREISDRWQQSLVLKRLIEEAWRRANANE